MRELDESNELRAGLLLDSARGFVGGCVTDVEMVEAEREEFHRNDAEVDRAIHQHFGCVVIGDIGFHAGHHL